MMGTGLLEGRVGCWDSANLYSNEGKLVLCMHEERLKPVAKRFRSRHSVLRDVRKCKSVVHELSDRFGFDVSRLAMPLQL